MNQYRADATDIVEDEIDLMDYLVTLLDARWFIIACLFFGALIGGLIGWIKTPVYQSDALLQIEDSQSSSIGGLEDLNALLGSAAPTEAEIEIIQSRRILGAVVDELKLDIIAEPRRFPVIGEAIALRGHGLPLDWLTDWLGPSYAWDDESIAVSTLDVEPELWGETLDLVVGQNGAFSLFDADGRRLGDGRVGELLVLPEVRLFVMNIHGTPGKHFLLTKLAREDAIAILHEALSVQEKGKSTGVLSLTLEDRDPVHAKTVLDAIANAYVRQNVERKSEEAQQSIEFLKKQLPLVKAQMDAAESKLNEYRLKHGSIDLKMEAQSILDQVVGVENAIAELDVKVEEIRARYTSNHPAMQTMLSKRQRLLHQKEALLAQVKSLPETEQKIIQLTRDTKVASELYTFLLNKYQELKVVKAGTVGNVRVIDFGNVPLHFVRPKRALIFVLSMTVALMLAVMLVFLRKAMNRAVEFPDEVEKRFGLPVYASVPHSAGQVELDRAREDGSLSILADVLPQDQAVEALRSLRTSLHFALLEAKNNLVMITGPSPSVGKSFVSMNFASVLVQSNKRVLLIDADMRKGRLHHYVDGKRSPGLSGIICGDVVLSECIHELFDGKLHVVTAGKYPPNPSELLLHENFSKLLDEVSYIYDVVVIDTPPVLAVTDPVIIGKHCGSCFLLLRSGRHTEREIEQAYNTLKLASVDVDGVIFNDIPPRDAYYKYGSHYHYQYHYKDAKGAT